MLRAVILTVAAALLGAPAALGAGAYGEVLSPSGKVLATADGSSFDYPADGSLVHIGGAEASSSGVTLTDLALFGGSFQSTQLYLPSGRAQPLNGTIAAVGRLVAPRPNTLVSLGPAGYVVVDQRARSKGHLGRVGLRLVLSRAAFGSAAGTQVVVGVPARSRAARPSRAAARGQLDPLAALGFAAADARLIGFDPTGFDPTGFDPTGTATADRIGERVVAIAERFLGVPYVWGGADPLTGFDCSGLALYAYAQVGVSLTHYTGAQFTEGMRLPRAALLPGDLVFFDNDPVRGPQHEGIYIGGGRFVQAPHTGDVVKVSSLDDPRYGLGYVGAVRPYAATR